MPFSKTKIKRILMPTIAMLVLALLTGATVKYGDSAKRFLTAYEIFTEVLQRIREDYVEEISSEALVEHAIEGMLTQLDPHSRYLSTDYFKRFNQNYEGYSGIGIEFDVIDRHITVMAVMKSGPAEKAGIIPGDRITAIEGKNAVGLTRDEAPQHLMGPKGTSVNVTVKRYASPDALQFNLTRSEIHVESVPYAFILKPGLGYIGILRFSSTTGVELEQAIIKLKAEGMRSLILDLRGNGGGYLDAAVDVADCFLPAGRRIVYTQGRGQKSAREFFATGRKYQGEFPVLVMIDRYSASASEIVSGALQDWDRGLIVGETSFGKALVQSQYRFRNGSALMMTTARYYTPAGRLIQRPYEEKTLEQYYAEVLDDSLRQIWLTETERPLKKSMLLKRKIVGGGGIWPDCTLASEPDTLSQLLKCIVRAPGRPIFKFTEAHIKKHPQLKNDFNHFMRHYQPTKTLIAQFLRYLKENGVSGLYMPTLQDQVDIRFFLKQSMADLIWGEEARYKIQLLRDVHLLEALDHLPETELLALQCQQR